MRILRGIAALILVTLIWGGTAGFVADTIPYFERFFPSPSKTLDAALILLQSQEFWSAFVQTNLRVVYAFAISISLALSLALLAARFEFFSHSFMPVNEFFRYVPVAAIVPLTILWLGISDVQRIAVLVFGTTFYAYSLIEAQLRATPNQLISLGTVLSFSKWRETLSIRFRYALPDIVETGRVCIGICWSYILVAEVVASDSGLGYLIIRNQRFLQMDNIFVIIIVLGLLGIVYDLALRLVRRVGFAWRA